MNVGDTRRRFCARKLGLDQLRATVETQNEHAHIEAPELRREGGDEVSFQFRSVVIALRPRKVELCVARATNRPRTTMPCVNEQSNAGRTKAESS